MRQLTIVVTTVLLVVLLNAPLVDAGRLWCRADPVVVIDGRVIDISLAIPLEDVLLVDGPTVYEITVPAGVDRQLVLNDVGFGHGSIITFRDGGSVQGDEIPITITASVSIDTAQLPPGSTVPMRLTVVVETLEQLSVPVITTEGTTDRVSARLVIPAR